MSKSEIFKINNKFSNNEQKRESAGGGASRHVHFALRAHFASFCPYLFSMHQNGSVVNASAHSQRNAPPYA